MVDWRRMVRVLWWLAVALYLGGLVGIGAFAAPAIFQQAKALGVMVPGTPTGLSADRYLGGETFGVVLSRFQKMEMVCLAVMTVVLAIDWAVPAAGIAGAKWPVSINRVLLVALLVVAGIDLLITTPRVFAVREQWFSAAGRDAALAQSAHEEFDQLHVRSEQQNQAKVWLLLGLLVVSAWSSYDPRPNQKV